MSKCRLCNTELSDENWYPSLRKLNNCICNGCASDRTRLWRKENPDKVKEIDIRQRRKKGIRSMGDNKECSQFLGVHVAERVLCHVFKDVEVMPYGNPGYDIRCNRDKLIDIKSSCLNKNGSWMFSINHNTTADYFLCVVFDNREDLNPMYIWLLPGCKFNHLKNAGIRPSTVHKWDEYKLDIDKVIACCNEMK